MKSIILLLLLSGIINCSKAQITTSIIKANFGVDGDLQSNFYKNSDLNGNDDWFHKYSGLSSGRGVIDTTGAAAILARYAIDPDFRQLPFYRTMSVPSFSIVNNNLWLDAIFTRDYHGNDSTVFASGASKNGMNPKDWSTPVVQAVPDKNEILDMMVHIKRAGPNIYDSLWMFGGISIENTSGDRYFDFEMYQTDIFYDRSTLKFSGYGPDAGHTSWKFDASGKVVTPGDIIFSAHYGGSTLTSIEARIWIDKALLSVTPASFNWSGSFDGEKSNSQFGYAGIIPKSSGNFYTGTENSNSTWAGAFHLVRGNNQLVTDYLPGQFMEFGVNLTKLGLDPVTLLGGDNCQMPFRRVLVKSRASTSFTAQLKDFVGPFDFFRSPKVKVASDINSLCGLMTISQISIINPVSTSTYSWSTPNGHIAIVNPDNSIVIDSVGTYIVTQKLQEGCSVYATDTIIVTRNPLCYTLQNSGDNFTGKIYNNKVVLTWSDISNPEVQYFEIEKSKDGMNFTTTSIIYKQTSLAENIHYNSTDYLDATDKEYVYYRLKTIRKNSQVSYSKVVRLAIEGDKLSVHISPNPVKYKMYLTITSETNDIVKLIIHDYTGRHMRTLSAKVQKGNTVIEVNDLNNWTDGIYGVKIISGNQVFTKKMLLRK